MPAQSTTLTPYQQHVLYPKPFNARGDSTFTAIIDAVSIDIQTKTIVHDRDQGIFAINGRNAVGADTFRYIDIQFADDTVPRTTFDLSKGEFTKTRLWLSVDSPAGQFSVRAISGTLSIEEISPQGISIKGTSVSTTEMDPNGVVHSLILDFDLHA